MNIVGEYTVESLIRDLIQIVTFIGMVVTLLKVFLDRKREVKKQESEIKKDEVDIKTSIISQLNESLEMAIKRAVNFETTIAEYDKKFIALNERIDELECNRLQQEAIIISLSEWAEALVAQIREHAPQIEPVKMKTPKKVDCKKTEI